MDFNELPKKLHDSRWPMCIFQLENRCWGNLIWNALYQLNWTESNWINKAPKIGLGLIQCQLWLASGSHLFLNSIRSTGESVQYCWMSHNKYDIVSAVLDLAIKISFPEKAVGKQCFLLYCWPLLRLHKPQCLEYRNSIFFCKSDHFYFYQSINPWISIFIQWNLPYQKFNVESNAIITQNGCHYSSNEYFFSSSLSLFLFLSHHL